jgi:hypothetical protein
MPWKSVGKTVYKKEGGKWKVHAHAKSSDNAKKMVKLLYMKENQ